MLLKTINNKWIKPGWVKLESIENPQILTADCGRYEGYKRLINGIHCAIGVEVGVREAFFSSFLVEKTRLYHTVGIDIAECPNARELAARNPYSYTFIKKDSIEASGDWPDKWFDFVHLDGSHKYNYVRQEIPAWYKKVRIGGVLSGDDYITYTCSREGAFGVTEAINKFVVKYGLKLSLIGYNETNLERLNEISDKVGQQLTRKVRGQDNSFTEIPNWYLIKEREIND